MTKPPSLSPSESLSPSTTTTTSPAAHPTLTKPLSPLALAPRTQYPLRSHPVVYRLDARASHSAQTTTDIELSLLSPPVLPSVDCIQKVCASLFSHRICPKSEPRSPLSLSRTQPDCAVPNSQHPQSFSHRAHSSYGNNLPPSPFVRTNHGASALSVSPRFGRDAAIHTLCSCL